MFRYTSIVVIIAFAASVLLTATAPVLGFDYSCDGTQDNVEIQAALDALPFGGGIISLAPGTYNLTETISRPIDNVIIEGSGAGTVLNYDNVHPVFSAGNQSNWVFRNLKTDSGGIDVSNAADWIEDDITIGTVYVRFGSEDTTVSPKSDTFITIAPTGNNDQIIINRSIDQGRRNLLLGEGVFDIKGDIVLDSGVKLLGNGYGTVLNFTNGRVIASDVSNVEVGDFQITGKSNPLGGVYIFANTNDCSNFFIHDIHYSSKGGNGFYIYVASHSEVNRTVKNVTFAKCSVNSPDGFGFVNSGEGTAPLLTDVTYYKCSVNDAGIAETRANPWVTAFDFVEYSQMKIANMTAIDCSGQRALESVFHFEDAPIKENCRLIFCEASFGGLKIPSPIYGSGFLITGDGIKAYNCFAHDNLGDGFVTGFGQAQNYEKLYNCASQNNKGVNFGNRINRFDIHTSYVPPVLSPIGNKAINEGTRLFFTVSATDPNPDSLIYSASNLPDGASFDPATRTFSWTPASSQAGSYPVRFQVSDGNLIATEDIMITVNNINVAPVFSPIGNKSVKTGATLTFTISAIDPDNDPLLYSASNLPDGASFDPATRTFSWTPASSQAGSYPVTFKVSDGNITAAVNITIKVNNVGRLPKGDGRYK